VKFCGNSPQKGGLVHQKGGRIEGKRGSCQMYDTEGPYQVFLWYRLGKYQENTNRYHTEIPNRDTTLVKTGYGKEGSIKAQAVGDLALNAFYCLLRIGEYTVKGKQNKSKQTVQFKLVNVSFFKKNKWGNLVSSQKMHHIHSSLPRTGPP
jgi:hypothetical protein